MAKELKGTKTHQNLKDAFAGESQANRRYLYFAKVADVEGYPEVAGNFRETADGETGHAHGHLDYLKPVGDPATGLPIGDTEQNLKAAIAGETHEYTDMYPGMAKTARDEGFDEIADWFETLAKAEKSHAGRFQKMLDDDQLRSSRPSRRRGRRRVPRGPPAARRPPVPSARRATLTDGHDRHDKTDLVPADGRPLLRPRRARATGTRGGARRRRSRARFEICHGCRMCFKYCDSFPIALRR